MRRPLVSTLVLIAAATAAGSAIAQVVPYRPGLPGATVGDIHRYENDRLRARSDANVNLARQQRLDARLTIQELQAARRPEPVQPTYRPLRSREQERALRQSATQRRESLSEDLGQIDDWLDRAPD